MTSSVHTLQHEIEGGSRIALAKAITLVESTRSDHRHDAEELLTRLLKRTGRALRVAISGPPGVGKSTFIEAVGLHLVGAGKKLAVLAIDPSSPVGGGSILGDKTRMEELSKSDGCFIRPSPSSGALGGVARHTRETILLCEAAGFDVIFVETVGIGQSETMAASMTDIFVQLHQPYSGDELQGIKKGVMELADIVVVTKADGDCETIAKLAQQDLERALSLTHNEAEDRPPVVCCSARLNQGITETWGVIFNRYQSRQKTGQASLRRQHQSSEWLKQEITSALMDILTQHPRYDSLLNETEHRVETSTEHCGRAARMLVQSLITQVN